MKHLYYVRHGQSTANVDNTIGGATDWQLTEKGKQQAVEAGQDAVRLQLKPDIIISSQLIRAYETAKAVAEALNINTGDIEISTDIQERFFGELEGKPESAFGVTKEYYLQNPRSIDSVEGVETIKDLHGRAEKVLKELKQRPEETILIVSHAAFGRSLRKAIAGVSFDAPTEDFDNAKIVKLI